MRVLHAATGFLAGAAVSTGATLAVQALGDEPIATVQREVRGVNHVTAGVAGGAALVAAGGFAIWAQENARSAAPGVSALIGASVGAVAGAYLLAPAIRRFTAEH